MTADTAAASDPELPLSEERNPTLGAATAESTKPVLLEILEDVMEEAGVDADAAALLSAAVGASDGEIMEAVGQIVADQGLKFTLDQSQLEAVLESKKELEGVVTEGAEEGVVYGSAAGGSMAAALFFELAQRRVAGASGQGVGSEAPSAEEIEAAVQLLALAEAEVAAEDAAIADEAGVAATEQLRDVMEAAHVASTAAAMRLVSLAQARVAARAGLSDSEVLRPVVVPDMALPDVTATELDSDAMLVDEGRIAVEASTPVGELSSESIKGDWDLTSDSIETISSADQDSADEVCPKPQARIMLGGFITLEC